MEDEHMEDADDLPHARAPQQIPVQMQFASGSQVSAYIVADTNAWLDAPEKFADLLRLFGRPRVVVVMGTIALTIRMVVPALVVAELDAKRVGAGRDDDKRLRGNATRALALLDDDCGFFVHQSNEDAAAAEGYLPAVLPPGAKGSPDDRVLTCLLWYNQLLAPDGVKKSIQLLTHDQGLKARATHLGVHVISLGDLSLFDYDAVYAALFPPAPQQIRLHMPHVHPSTQPEPQQPQRQGSGGHTNSPHSHTTDSHIAPQLQLSVQPPTCPQPREPVSQPQPQVQPDLQQLLLQQQHHLLAQQEMQRQQLLQEQHLLQQQHLDHQQRQQHQQQSQHHQHHQHHHLWSPVTRQWAPMSGHFASADAQQGQQMQHQQQLHSPTCEPHNSQHQWALVNGQPGHAYTHDPQPAPFTHQSHIAAQYEHSPGYSHHSGIQPLSTHGSAHSPSASLSAPAAAAAKSAATRGAVAVAAATPLPGTSDVLREVLRAVPPALEAVVVYEEGPLGWEARDPTPPWSTALQMLEALGQTSRTLQLQASKRTVWEGSVKALEGCARRLERRRALDSDLSATEAAAAPAAQLLDCLSDSLRIHAARSDWPISADATKRMQDEIDEARLIINEWRHRAKAQRNAECVVSSSNSA